MEKLKKHIKKLGTSNTVECLVCNTNEKTFYLHSFKKVKNEITHDSEKYFQRVEELLDYFLQQKKVKSPVILGIIPLSGFTISFPENISSEKKLEYISTSYPGIDIDKLFIQCYDSDETAIGIINNNFEPEPLRPIFEQLKNRLISVACFPFPLIQLLNITTVESNHVQTSFYSLIRKQNNEWEVENLDATDNAPETISLFGSKLPGHQLLPYSIAINYFEHIFPSYILSPNWMYAHTQPVNQQRFHWKNFQRKALYIALPAILVLLLINNLLISRYENRMESEQNIKLTIGSLRHTNAELKKELGLMGVDYSNLNDYLGFTQFSKIINEIGASIPKNIKLRSLSFAKPEESKKSSREAGITFHDNIIEITGVSQNIVTYSNWLDLLRETPVFISVENISYEEDHETLESYFKIRIQCNKTP